MDGLRACLWVSVRECAGEGDSMRESERSIEWKGIKMALSFVRCERESESRRERKRERQRKREREACFSSVVCEKWRNSEIRELGEKLQILDWIFFFQWTEEKYRFFSKCEKNGDKWNHRNFFCIFASNHRSFPFWQKQSFRPHGCASSSAKMN